MRKLAIEIIHPTIMIGFLLKVTWFAAFAFMTVATNAQSEFGLRYGVGDYDLRDVVKDAALGADSSLTVTRLAGSSTIAAGADFLGFLNDAGNLYGYMAVFYNSTTAMGNADFTYTYTSPQLLPDTVIQAQAIFDYWNLKLGVGFQPTNPDRSFGFRFDAGLDMESGAVVLFDDAVRYFLEEGYVQRSGITAQRSLLFGAFFRMSGVVGIGQERRLKLLITPGLKWVLRLNDRDYSDYFSTEPARLAIDATVGLSYIVGE